MKAVHFGAGNIGRGFVGLLLSEAGFEVTFADVAQGLIEALQNADSYVVHEVGEGARDHTVTGFKALNSAADQEAVVAAIADADVVTTAVGPNILRFVAPVIRAGIDARSADAPKLAVMACENAINATDTLAEAIRGEHGDPRSVDDVAVFANTAVDRIVPAQAHDAGLDVTVETYYEWAIEKAPFGDAVPPIAGVTWVDSLGPYIERKLFTVNTGHASTAYFGYEAGIEKISDVLDDAALKQRVYAVLQETKALLVAKYGFAPKTQEAYVRTILQRFANPALPDTVVRVGRAPQRKLSRHERFIGPAAELAERGMATDALQAAMLAAMTFDVPDDPEAVEVGEILASSSGEGAATKLTGLDMTHPLFPAVAEVCRQAKARRQPRDDT